MRRSPRRAEQRMRGIVATGTTSDRLSHSRPLEALKLFQAALKYRSD